MSCKRSTNIGLARLPSNKGCHAELGRLLEAAAGGVGRGGSLGGGAGGAARAEPTARLCIDTEGCRDGAEVSTEFEMSIAGVAAFEAVRSRRNI